MSGVLESGVPDGVVLSQKVSSPEDPTGLTTSWSYTGNNFSSTGGTTTITGPHGNVEVEDYTDGFLTSVTKGSGSPSALTVDYSVCLPVAPATTCTVGSSTYQAGQDESKTVSPSSNPETTTYTFDALGNLLSTTDPMGLTTTASGYNALDEPTSTTSPSGIVTSYSYDATGNLTSQSVTPAPGCTGSCNPQVTTYTVCESASCTVGLATYTRGETESVRDPRGYTTAYAYNPAGQVTSTTNPDGDTTLSAYDQNGRLYCSVSPVQVAAGVVCPASESQRNPNTQSETFNGDGQVATSTDPSGNVTQTLYDVPQSSSSLIPCVPTTTLAPTAQYCTVTIDPMHNIAVVAYDLSGRVVATTTGYGTPTASTTYNAYDIPPGPAPSPCSTSVAGASYCTTTTNGGGQVTVDYFNAAGEHIEDVAPGNVTTAMTYDPAGNLSTSTKASGTATDRYNLDNQLTSVAYSAPGSGFAASADVTYQYNAFGQRTSMTDGTGTTTYSYDSFGRMISTTNGAGAVVSYAYDQDGNVTGVTYPNGKTVTRSFDHADQLVAVTDWLGHTTAITPNANGQVASIASPNATDTYTYNPSGFTTSATFASGQAGAETQYAGLNYTPNANNQVATTTSTGLPGPASSTYGYTSNSQLASNSSLSGGYAYDPAGNLTQLAGGTTQAYNAAGQLCNVSGTTAASCAAPPVGSTTYSYDANGNRTGAANATGPTQPSLTYNQANELANVNQGNYVPVTPTRVCGSWIATPGVDSQCLGKTLTTNQTMSVHVAGPGLPVPADATAVVAEVTTSYASGNGYVTAFPYGQPLPQTASVGVMANTPETNQVTVAIGANGAYGDINLYNLTGTIAIEVDVVGYYTQSPTSASTFTPIQPQRICETYPIASLTGGDAQCASTRLTATTPVTVQVAGLAGVPQGATAATIDVGALWPSANVTIQAVKGGSPPGGGVTLSGNPGTFVVQETTVPLSSSGTITLYANASVAIATVDVEGYFTGNGGSLYNPVTPTRVCSTIGWAPLPAPYAQCNNQPQSNNQVLNVKVAGLAGVPADATAVVIDLSELFATTSGNAVVYPQGAPQPDTISMSYPPGDQATNEVTTQVNATNGEISILDYGLGTGTTNPMVDVIGYYGPNETYNGVGQRMSENIGTTTQSFTYDNVTAAVPAVLQDANYSYVYGPTGPGGQQLPIEEIPTSGGGSPIYLHHDQLGSTVALTNSSGTVVGTESYSDYGSLAASTGSAASPIGFAGAYTDYATGYLYLFNRFYDPGTGQFVSVDPLVGITGQPYAYVGGDPLNATDPLGLLWCVPHGVIGPCPKAPPGVNYNSSCLPSQGPLTPGSTWCGDPCPQAPSNASNIQRAQASGLPVDPLSCPAAAGEALTNEAKQEAWFGGVFAVTQIVPGVDLGVAALVGAGSLLNATFACLGGYG